MAQPPAHPTRRVTWIFARMSAGQFAGKPGVDMRSLYLLDQAAGFELETG